MAKRKKARCLTLDVIGGTGFKEVECDELQDFYDALQCDCFDIATRKIGGKYFDIFVDDCGLFKENPIVSAIDKDMKPALVGNLVFAHHDREGNTTGVTDEDIELIKKNSVGLVYFDREDVKSWTAVYPVEY